MKGWKMNIQVGKLNKIKKIISSPTYVAKNPKQDSIEYIKEYKNDNKFVLVAVSNKGNLFTRTLFTMTDRKKNIYLRKVCKKIQIKLEC